MGNEELQVMFEAVKVVSEHQRKQNDTIKKMFFGLLITITLIVTGVCGTVLYIWNNSEVIVEDTITTTVEQDTGENGDIVNGNQFKADTQNFEGGVEDGETKNNKN
jgi:hypothetical protein